MNTKAFRHNIRSFGAVMLVVIFGIFSAFFFCSRHHTTEIDGSSGTTNTISSANIETQVLMSQQLEPDNCRLDERRQSWEEDDVLRLEQREGTTYGDFDSEYRAYTPQLMDTQEMQALRTALNRSEMQIQQQGHMKEYVPRKPASSTNLRRWYGLPRNHRAVNRPILSAGPSTRQDLSVLTSKTDSNARLEERPRTAVRPMSTGVRTAEFARILKQETRQVRELEHRYEETKRSLLDYIEVVTSCKPNDRVGGQEVYEQLADLILFASQGNTTE